MMVWRHDLKIHVAIVHRRWLESRTDEPMSPDEHRRSDHQTQIAVGTTEVSKNPISWRKFELMLLTLNAAMRPDQILNTMLTAILFMNQSMDVRTDKALRAVTCRPIRVPMRYGALESSYAHFSQMHSRTSTCPSNYHTSDNLQFP